MKDKILEWLKCAGIRASKTVAQTAVATIRNVSSNRRCKLVNSSKY